MRFDTHRRQPKRFADREDAAAQLSTALAHLKGSNPLVLAIPRGAVPMGRIVASALDGELDVVLIRKLGAPGNPELAVGAIDESGWVYLAEHARQVGATDDYLEREKRAQLETIRARRAEYTPVRAPIDPKQRVVVIVDDGLATGSTMIAALHALRARQPARLVCAVPVAPPSTLERVRPLCDELVCLIAPMDFYGVGQFYDSFPQVSDQEVMRLLGARPEHSPGPQPG